MSSRHKLSLVPPLQPLRISICSRRLARGLTAFVALLVLTGGVAHFVGHQVAPHSEHVLANLIQRFDLGHKPSLPNWYSSLALLAVAGVAALLAHAERGQALGQKRLWLAFSVLFVGLAADEALTFHELANRPMRALLGSEEASDLAWAIPGSGFALVALWFFWPLITVLELRVRNQILAAGALIMVGAIGIEILEGLIVTPSGSLTHISAEMLGEGLEMMGVVLILYALSDLLSRRVESLQIEFPPRADHTEPDLHTVPIRRRT